VINRRIDEAVVGLRIAAGGDQFGGGAARSAAGVISLVIHGFI